MRQPINRSQSNTPSRITTAHPWLLMLNACAPVSVSSEMLSCSFRLKRSTTFLPIRMLLVEFRSSSKSLRIAVSSLEA